MALNNTLQRLNCALLPIYSSILYFSAFICAVLIDQYIEQTLALVDLFHSFLNVLFPSLEAIKSTFLFLLFDPVLQIQLPDFND